MVQGSGNECYHYTWMGVELQLCGHGRCENVALTYASQFTDMAAAPETVGVIIATTI